ncbi:FIG049039: Transcriptional regulator, LysR family [hydrothermal vent metagenome]|uniref:FIG049039: Transcriptional regulator, LysR family n=1 Tax=hydrothermal vent metagenome TaxID=652676 RepID=A0A3B0TTK7_9ZZZZ
MITFDSDHLKTFTAIAETGSFSRAATRVHKTQSAVSMQMKRLEETVGRALFLKEGRRNRLTREGDRLLDYATRLVRLNEEAARAFSAPSLTGMVRLGTPDDYADRFLPPVLARFVRSHPGVELEVLCEPSIKLTRSVAKDELDLAIITQCDSDPVGQVIRRENLLWVTSQRACVHTSDVVPMALGPTSCCWRQASEIALNDAGKSYRVAFTSANATANTAVVLSGLAVSVFPESAVRPGMTILEPADGFPPLPPCEVALLRGTNKTSEPVAALADHIVELLGNHTERRVADIDMH